MTHTDTPSNFVYTLDTSPGIKAALVSATLRVIMIMIILFIIMISDLGRELIYSVVSKFSDDTKNIARISNLTDAERFQYELENIVYPWVPENNMTLNGDKFE